MQGKRQYSVTNKTYKPARQILTILITWFKKLSSQKMVCLFVWLVALRPKSTAMVMAGRSVRLTVLFPG